VKNKTLDFAIITLVSSVTAAVVLLPVGIINGDSLQIALGGFNVAFSFINIANVISIARRNK
jgi:hypothetical protein